jgi:hypothetical protein
LQEALACYNEAVRLAPFPGQKEETKRTNDSTALGFAFGNRSAVLARMGRHGDTVRDVDWALEYGYPLDSASKLVIRKVQALLANGQPGLAAATLKVGDLTIFHRVYPPITYSWTVPLILDHPYLVGNLTNSKIADTKVSGF